MPPTSANHATPVDFCVYEDRPALVNGLKLCLLSIKRQMPSAVTHTFDNALVRSLAGWLSRQKIALVIHPATEENRGWSIKPFLLEHLLKTGLSSVVWLDADTIVVGPLDRFLARYDSSTLVATEEPRSPFDPAKGRAQVWGDTPWRALSSTLNSALVKVSSAHRDLVRLWRERVCDPRYLEAQTHPAATRPVALFSDQDVLEGLLIGRFADVPLILLKQGSEIIQDFWMHDYLIRDRLRNAFGRRSPLLVHGQSLKPWDLLRPGAEPHPLREYREVGTYAMTARRYQKELDEPSAHYWLQPTSTQGKFINSCVFGSPHLAGAVLSLRDHSHHLYRKTRARCWSRVSKLIRRSK